MYSNWGDCVNIYAPGSVIYAAIAHNDTSYSWYSGTSTASGAICGIIANILWVDPTLTFSQIVNILNSNGTKITGQSCDNIYNCIMPKYNCNSVNLSLPKKT